MPSALVCFVAFIFFLKLFAASGFFFSFVCVYSKLVVISGNVCSIFALNGFVLDV